MFLSLFARNRGIDFIDRIYNLGKLLVSLSRFSASELSPTELELDFDCKNNRKIIAKLLEQNSSSLQCSETKLS